MVSDNKVVNVKIRPASLEDASKIAKLQNDHAKELKIVEMPKSSDKIRISIGSSFLNKNTYFVVEENNEIIGYIEQTKQNHSHVMISYPFVQLNHPLRKEIQFHLVKTTLDKMIKFGYQFVSTQVSQYMYEAIELFENVGFDQKQTIFQTYSGYITPDEEIRDNVEFRRVNQKDLDIVYRWIERQLNPLSPIFITKEYLSKLLQAPKKVRDGWSMAIDPETKKPLAMISSMIDIHTGDVIIFGPFNEKGHDEIRNQLFNELLWYHTLHGRESMRLMRIELFDNDEELISNFGLDKTEEICILSKKLY